MHKKYQFIPLVLSSLLEMRTSEIVKINSKLETKQNYLLKKSKIKDFTTQFLSNLLFLSQYKNRAQQVRMTICEGQ